MEYSRVTIRSKSFDGISTCIVFSYLEYDVKGGIKVHTNIHVNEGLPSDIRFTSATTNVCFILKTASYTILHIRF